MGADGQGGAAISPLKQLAALGQSPWLDFISRDFVASGKLARLVDADGLGGVTSNPAIFEKAIASGAEYEDALRALAADPARDANAIYEALAIADIQAAADVLAHVHKASGGRDGFVSLEVSPYLAHDTAGTIAEARRLWAAVDRANLMVKVPGTAAGVEAIRTLTADGISINVTLLFSLDAYIAVALAYAEGLEARIAAGRNVAGIGSVASFFVSRIDSVIDKKIDTRIAAGDAAAEALAALRGKVAIANAKLAYAWFEDFMASPRGQSLIAAGAAPQRLLWASTGTKDPSYPDVLYVNTLIGPQTVNTLPPATMDAFRDHGTAAPSLREGLDEARAVIDQTAALGLDLPGVTSFLVADGVKQFADAADRLLAAVEARRAAALGAAALRVQLHAAHDLHGAHAQAMNTWQQGGKTRALWARDASLWTGSSEQAWLGWLDAPQTAAAQLAHYEAFARDIDAAGFSDVLLLGMGGSSLGPEVIGAILPARRRLHVLDSTQPDQVARVTAACVPASTLVIVASKSGTTLEPAVMERFLWTKMQDALGAAAGAHFIAITDPGSALADLAAAKSYRRVFLGDPQIGGRFSVLSPFGLAVGAAIGADLGQLVAGARKAAAACAALTPAQVNPGVMLGLAMARAARAGRDKLTMLMPAALAPFGAWVEQLIAESIDKHGQLILPIAGEAEEAPSAYGADRLFCEISTAPALSARAAALHAAGHPVLHLQVEGAGDLAQLFFVFEIATAVAGAELGLNPFDQPDVEATKVKTRAITDAIRATGALPDAGGSAVDGFVLRGTGSDAASLPAALERLFAGMAGGDYVCLLAYLDQNPQHESLLQTLRRHIGRITRSATLLQFGPRFLHSTGQAFKGGPNSGIFLQITADPAADLAVPGESISFGQVCAAQARGDFDVMSERGRRILHLHVPGPALPALQRLDQLLDHAQDR